MMANRKTRRSHLQKTQEQRCPVERLRDAISTDDLLIAEFQDLLQTNIDVHARDAMGRNIFHYIFDSASEYKTHKLIATLIDLGVDPNRRDNEENHPLLSAFMSRNNSLNLLDEEYNWIGWDFSGVNKKGQSVFLSGVSADIEGEALRNLTQHYDRIGYLEGLGWDINEKDRQGNNAAHLIAMNFLATHRCESSHSFKDRCLSHISDLVLHGLDWNARNNVGDTFIDIVEKGGLKMRSEIMTTLHVAEVLRTSPY